jgi:hypothetical protein
MRWRMRQRNIGNKKEMFFFKKKNQKTFVCSDTRRGNVSDRGDGAGIKVFCFFFSKKNTFSALWSNCHLGSAPRA